MKNKDRYVLSRMKVSLAERYDTHDYLVSIKSGSGKIVKQFIAYDCTWSSLVEDIMKWLEEDNNV